MCTATITSCAPFARSAVASAAIASRSSGAIASPTKFAGIVVVGVLSVLAPMMPIETPAT